MLIGIVASKQISHKVEPAQPIFEAHGESEIIWEEEHHHLPDRPYDILYARPGGWIGLNLLFEAVQRGITVVNHPAALLSSMDRMVSASILRGEGLPVPDFFCGYPHSAPFLPFVAKNIFDVAGFKQSPVVVHTTEEQQALPRLPVFGQAYLESEWEYKVYGLGPAVLMYRQRPTLEVEDKMSTRERIAPREDMVMVTQQTMRLLGLEICSLDFLEDKTGFFLTDINFSPALETDPKGYPLLAKFLVAKVKQEAQS